MVNVTKSSEVIDTLNDLIETCKDGEYGFRVSAEQAIFDLLEPARAFDEAREVAFRVNSTQLHRVRIYFIETMFDSDCAPVSCVLRRAPHSLVIVAIGVAEQIDSMAKLGFKSRSRLAQFDAQPFLADSGQNRMRYGV